MLHFERWKIIAIVLTCLAGVLFTLPNFFSKETVDSWPRWLPHKQLPLGLDLRGGAHLLLAMDTKELEKDWLNTLRDDTRKTLREAKVGFTGLGVVGNSVQVKVTKPEDMDKALTAPRPDLSAFAPRIVTMMISPEKIGDLIGPKGKTIRGIQDETGAELTVDDTGLVTIAAVGGESMERARQMVQALTAEPVIGETYEGTVKSTTAFGAFVEIMPGTEGLVHISELKHGRTEKTEDVVKKGDRVKVKLLERDERGRLRLSMKALVPKPEGGAFGEGSGEGGSGSNGRSTSGRGESTSETPDDGYAPATEATEEAGAAVAQREERPRRPRGGRSSRSGGGRSRE